MQKSDVVSAIAEKLDMKQSKVNAVIDAYIEVIAEAYDNGERVDMRGFGTFMKKHRAAKVGRNIATNTPINLPEKDVLCFKPSKMFYER